MYNLGMAMKNFSPGKEHKVSMESNHVPKCTTQVVTSAKFSSMDEDSSKSERDNINSTGSEQLKVSI